MEEYAHDSCVQQGIRIRGFCKDLVRTKKRRFCALCPSCEVVDFSLVRYGGQCQLYTSSHYSRAEKGSDRWMRTFEQSLEFAQFLLIR